MRKTTITLIAAALLAVSACSDSGAGDSATTTAAPEAAPSEEPEAPPAETAEAAVKPTPTPTPTPERSNRGLIIKEIGEVAGFLSDDGTEMATEFTVDAIEVSAECTEDYADVPQNGHFIVITITATVLPGFADPSAGISSMPFGPGEFGLVDANGITVNDPAPINTYGCLAESELIPDEVGEGETATGKVVLDSPTEHGVLTYQPWFTGGSEGWEWEF
ncbi:hypothetical protein [Jiangella mangrovi]|uniref:DUF4352 domain-containing protein n=1 Tax=Jiangella mangrovi TaxID=1524084 RepID=A0A7W9GY26_9ACTN|nr:hypothetical protein [Jiangella mangrovi]MBB5791766.1 hypothetical protein [Jiangella mangrovi]